MPQVSMNDQIARLVATTLPNYITPALDNVVRNQKLLAWLQKKAKIKYNQKGRFPEWTVEYKYGRTRTRSPGDTITFDYNDRFKNCSLPWAQYYQSDNYTEEESMRNSGAEGIIKYYDELPERLVTGLQRDIGYELYNDANTSGQVNHLAGFETLFGNTGSAITGAFVMTPSGNYAGLSKVLANYGGSNLDGKPWPIGRFTEDYDFFSPLILDVTSTLVKTASNYAFTNLGGWSNRAFEALRFAITHSQRNVPGKDAMMSMFLMDLNYYAQLKNIVGAYEKINTNRGESSEGLVSMGFRDILNIDGVDCTAEYGIPPSTVYGMNVAQVSLLCEKDKLFVSRGPTWDPHHNAYLVLAQLFGQIFFNPRHAVKIAEYGTTGA